MRAGWVSEGFTTIDHMHTVTKLIEVSRECEMPVCLTSIDVKKPPTQLKLKRSWKSLLIMYPYSVHWGIW